MASYTMTVKEMIESYTYGEQNLSHRERIEKGRKSLLNFSYPIFDETYRGVFETHLIREFYMVEIGFETEELFKFNLETWLNVHMPYFNQLFLSEQIKFDPLKNTKVDMQHTKDTTKQQDDTTNQIQDTKTAKDTGITASSKEDSTSTADGTNNNVSTSTNDGTSKVTDSSTDNTKTTNASDTDTVSSGKESSFGRDTEADTPQNRLRLQPEDDGVGVIEYASKIEEEKRNASNSSNQSVNTHGSTTSDTDRTGTSNQTTHDEGGSTSKTTTHDESNSNTTQSMNQKVDEDTVQNLIGKQTLDSDISELEEYVQHREGKIGVQSYSKMMTEYRETFLRIERDIFREMRKELFMLIY